MLLTNLIGYIELFKQEGAWQQVGLNYLSIALSSFMLIFVGKFNTPSKINGKAFVEILINSWIILPVTCTGFVFFYSYLTETLQLEGAILSLFGFIPALMLWFYLYVDLGDRREEKA